MKRIEVFAYFTTVLITINSILRTKFRLGVFKLWIIIFNFENAEVGEEKINYALETLEEFGGMKIKEFYQKKMEKYLKKSI